MPVSVRGRVSTRPGVLSCLFGLILFFAPLRLFAASSVVIGEVNWSGSSRSTADEWVELWNVSSQDQPLTGWSLEGASAHPLLFTDTDHIPPYSTFLIANYDETNTKSALNAHAQLATTDVALSNDSLHLVLRDREGSIVSEAGDGNKPPAGTSKPMASMVRLDPFGNAWGTATSTNGFDALVIDEGTPGICDGCIVEETPDIPFTNTPDALESTSSSQAVTPPPDPTATSSTDTILLLDTSSSLTEPPLTDTPQPSLETASSSSPMSEDPSLLPMDHSSTTSTLVTEAILEDPLPTNTPASSTEPVDSEPSSSDSDELPPSLTSSTVSCSWKLTTLFPAPNNGSEFVVITGCNDSSRLLGWSIHDAQGSILTVTSSTVLTLTETGGWQINLPGQHLNNTGDSVFLYGPDDKVYDNVTYPSVQHDEHYLLREDGTWSIPERVPTIPTPIIVISTPPSTSLESVAPPLASSTTSLVATTATSSSARKSVTKRITTTTVHASSTSSTRIQGSSKKVVSSSYAEYQAQRPHTAAAKMVATKPKPALKTTKRKTTSAMPTSSLAPRVYLHGVVGTPPNLIAKRRFVLLNTDGTGLLVYSNGLQPSPALGTSIAIYGTLVTNDEGTHLEMRARDRWASTKTAFPDPKTTPVDLLSIDPDHNWDFVELSGRVQTHSATNIHLDVDGTDIIVALPRLLGYRAQRLQVGDLVQIRGVLNSHTATPQIHPRSSDEIVLINHANTPSSLAAVGTRNTSLPPWIPMGAASVSVAAGYGFMRWRTWYKQKQLEHQLTLAIDHLSSST